MIKVPHHPILDDLEDSLGVTPLELGLDPLLDDTDQVEDLIDAHLKNLLIIPTDLYALAIQQGILLDKDLLLCNPCDL